uniref:Potassium channel tetramerization domain containing 19 n=1 Tax=Pavo cristatus TaxID=9049 RepID=A0A8C9G7D5_PAVCR
MKEPESTIEPAEEESINFNVGGWYFSLPRSKVAQFPNSLLWKEASVQDWSENLRLFIDQDGFVFRHLHYYMQTSKLSSLSCTELNLLYEQALVLQLTPLIQILGNLKEDSSRVQPADIPVAERVPLNNWRTHKSANRPSEIPPKSPVFAGLHERTPLGLVDTPLLDTEEEVNYCFLPLDLVRKYPMLVNDDNLLWLLENAALIECDYSEFRFIVNFLRSKKMLLPDDFSNIDALEEEALTLGIPELTEAVRIYRGTGTGCPERWWCPVPADSGVAARRGAGGRRSRAGRRAARYAMALGLLRHYPDSALGQLLVGSDLGRHRLHVCGSGVLFQHARNWLGTCQLPLTENISEIQELYAYLDKGDVTYEPMKEQFCLNIVKVYVGSNWYETSLRTLLKYPELLSNDKKVCWITYGQSLLIHGDGQMFRHVLNFLRLGKLFLPAEFKEWPLFCQEAEEYRIPPLSEALYHCSAYRLWIQNKELRNEDSFPCRVPWNKEREVSKDPREAKPPKMVPQTGGTKRKNTAGGYDESSPSMVKSSLRLESPPRKRGMRSSLRKQAENKDSAIDILKLLSLVKEWGTLNSKRWDSQHVKVSDGCVTGTVPPHGTPEQDRGVKPSIACSAGKMRTKLYPFTEPRDSQRLKALQEAHRNVGVILKVEHPPVIGSDGCHTWHEESIVYSTLLGDIQLEKSNPQGLPQDTIFLCFALSHEEMFYARKCHFFLTDVILDSIRQKDPKEITAKVMTLVHRLWTQQITPKEFVGDLLSTEYFKGDRNVREQLLKWVEFTLPSAWKYSHCLQLLIQRGFARSVSSFTLGM